MSFVSHPYSQRFIRGLALLLLLAAVPAPVQGQGLSHNFEVSGWFQIKEGTRVGNLYIEAVMDDGYHCYSQHHKGTGIPSAFVVPESEQFKILGGFEPDRPPHKYLKDGEDFETFEEKVVWSAPIELVDGVEPEDLDITVLYSGLACDKDGCGIPYDQEPLELFFDDYVEDLVIRQAEDNFDPSSISAVADTPAAEVKTTETPEQIEAINALYDVDSKINFERLDGSTGNGSFITALVGAFLGGILLNLMPCVFPVLGLKVMGFVEQAGNEPRKIRLHGIAFAFGLIFSMWCLAGVILAIKASGSNVTWGQQMGNAYFIGGIVILLFVLGLNLAGVFEMGLFMTRVGGDGEHKGGYTGSFISGIITTLVATPCSGPFLGAAMGYTLAQPAMIALFLFTVFGLGIAVPYLIMSFFPSLINMLPRPGAWMETFKKLMAFTLFAAAAFFVKSFAVITGYDGIGMFLLALCVISLGFFFYGKYSPGYVAGKKRYIWGWLVPLLICGTGFWMYTVAAKYEAPVLASKVDEHGWLPWIPGRVEQQLDHRKPVWVDYTANW